MVLYVVILRVIDLGLTILICRNFVQTNIKNVLIRSTSCIRTMAIKVMAYIFEYLNWTYYQDYPESVTRIHGLLTLKCSSVLPRTTDAPLKPITHDYQGYAKTECGGGVLCRFLRRAPTGIYIIHRVAWEGGGPNTWGMIGSSLGEGTC